MTILFYILIGCFLCMGMLIGFVLFYVPKKTTISKESSYQEEVLSNVLNPISLRVVKDLRIRWPELDIMLEKENTDHVLFLKWKGLVKKEKILVFYFREEDELHSLFEAVARSNARNDTPTYRFVIVLENCKNNNIPYEISEYVHNLHLPIVGAFTDGEGFLHHAKADLFLVSAGRKSQTIFSGEKDQIRKWLPSIPVRELYYDKDLLDEYFDTFEDEFSFPMKLQYFFYKRKFLDNLMICYPQLKNQFYPSFHLKNDQLVLETTNEEQKEQILSILREFEQKKNLNLKLVQEIPAVPLAEFSSLDERIEECLFKEMKFTRMIRTFESLDSFTMIPGVTTRGIALKKEGIRLKGEASVRFYEDLLNE